MDITFLTGFGSGLCLGVSLWAFKKYKGIFSEETSSNKVCKEEITAKEHLTSAENEYQLVLVIRSDAQLTKGEVATRCSSASLAAFERVIMLDPVTQAFWNSIGKPSIALKTDSEEELKRLYETAKEMGLITSTACDELDSKSVTVLGIGPAGIDILIQLVGHLKLL